MRKAISSILVGTVACAMSAQTLAAQFSVEVTNLTRGSYFTPLMVAAHTPSASLFTSGQPASPGLQEMAEGGALTGVTATLESIGSTFVANPAEGLLGPGASATAEINTDAAESNTHLSVVSMILPSNDGFIGMNTVEVPTEPGVYTFLVNAYDSGTEANDELVGSPVPGEAGFPAPGPVGASSGANGTGYDATAEGFVHIHRGVLGDTDIEGGVSDINSVVHRWLNPVARVVVTVN